MSLKENKKNDKRGVPGMEVVTMAYTGDGSDIVSALQNEKYLFFLDSSRVDPVNGRYSLIGFDPFYVFSGKGTNLLNELRREYSQFSRTVQAVAGVPFVPGIVGYLSYDYGLTQERIKLYSKSSWNIPDAVFGFYDNLIVIDRVEKQLHILSTGLPEMKEELRRQRARSRLKSFQQRVVQAADQRLGGRENQHRKVRAAQFTLKENFSREEYIRAVKKILAYIAAGDVYQVNLSQRFESDLGLGQERGWEIYQSLRDEFPTSFSAYFKTDEFQLLCSSPERFLSLREASVQSKPMKGTRPRGRSVSEDNSFRREILNSAKDKAELLMITDLVRNDLGKVCRTGSVRVRSMRDIEEYATVFQATSTVEGELHPDKDCFDLIQACFPAGSITGCPKIRSMEIIEELEPTRRGIYTGCMGYIDFAGRMDLNIMIRTMLLYQGKVYFQTGGGIVADSDPATEYQETLVKAQAMRAALEKIYGC